MELTLDINGHSYRLGLDPHTTLLDALRESVGLTGTKKGCDQGSADRAPCWWAGCACWPASPWPRR